jgi:hypothetical protein
MRDGAFIVLLSLGLTQGWVTSAYAVAGIGDAVYDFAVHVESIAIAANTVATATNTATIIEKWVAQLTALGGFVVQTSEFKQDLAIGMDVQSLRAQLAFFQLDGAPSTSLEFAERMTLVRGIVFECYSYALRTQTLISTTLSTVQHVLTLAEDIAQAIGGLQSTQVIAQYEAQLVQMQSEMKLQNAAFQHAQAVAQLSEPLIEQSIRNINEAVWSKEP